MANTTYVGTKKVYDENGNEILLDMIHKKNDNLDRKGWRRVILGDLLEVIDSIGNKKIKVLEYLIDNMNGSNEIDLTQREVADGLKVSIQTVSTTFKELEKANLIKKIKRKYVLNTQIVSAYGSKEKNTMLCINYEFYDGANKKPKKKKTIDDRIAEKQKELQDLIKAKEAREKEKADKELLKQIKNDTIKNANNPLYSNINMEEELENF